MDTVATLFDNPSKIDQLDRKNFAQALTTRIDNLYFQDDPPRMENQKCNDG